MLLALADLVDPDGETDAWAQLLAEVELEGAELGIAPERDYDDRQVMALMRGAARRLGIDERQLHYRLGRLMAAGLVDMGRSLSVLPEHWKTLDILEHINDLIQAVRRLSGSPSPYPDALRTLRITYGEVALAYRSPRRLCHMIRGILEGLGELFEEPVAIQEPICLHQGGVICRMAITLDDPMLARFVDVEREFHTVHLRQEQVIFYNQWLGVPVSSAGEVMSFDRERVTVRVAPNQLTAMHKQGKTYFSLPHLVTGLEANVARVDVKQNVVVLENIYLTDGAVGRRVQERVEPDRDLPMELMLRQQTVTGRLLNLSTGGVMMAVEEGEGFEEFIFETVTTRFMLPFDWVDTEEALVLGPQQLVLSGNLLDVDSSLEGHRLRVLFSPLTLEQVNLINQYVTNRQEEVMAKAARGG